MAIDVKSSYGALQSALKQIEKERGPNARIKPSEVKDKGLKALVNDVIKHSEVSTGCGVSAPERITLKRLKDALKTVGVEARAADKDKDGVIDAHERQHLSPLAARMLQLAGTEERPHRTGTGRRVSTGCSGGGSRPTVTPSRVGSSC